MHASACSREYDESSAKYRKIALFKKELVENHGCIRERLARGFVESASSATARDTGLRSQLK